MTAPTLDTSTRGIAEHLLETLHLLNQADNQRLAVQNGGAYGDVREALIKVLAEEDWGRSMANEAIYLAMSSNISMVDALLATRTGTNPIERHATAATPVDSGSAITEITDEIAREVADAIGEHFRADRDYWPQVMHSDWDGGSGRVIVWADGLPDWAFLAGDGGISDDIPIEYGPVPLPAGVWVEPVNPQALRVLPNPR